MRPKTVLLRSEGDKSACLRATPRPAVRAAGLGGTAARIRRRGAHGRNDASSLRHVGFRSRPQRHTAPKPPHRGMASPGHRRRHTGACPIIGRHPPFFIGGSAPFGATARRPAFSPCGPMYPPISASRQTARRSTCSGAVRRSTDRLGDPSGSIAGSVRDPT